MMLKTKAVTGGVLAALALAVLLLVPSVALAIQDGTLLDTLRSSYTQAAHDVSNAESEATAATAEYESAESALNAVVNDPQVIAARELINTTQAALAEAQTTYDAAQSALDDANSALAGNSSDIANAQEAVAQAQQRKDAADEAVNTGPQQVAAAQAEYDQAVVDQADAQQAYNTAVENAAEQAALGSFGFFASVGADDALSAFDSSGIRDYTHQEESVDATSLDNMLATIQWIRECNNLRVSRGQSELMVTDRLMAIAQLDANYSDVTNQHADFASGVNGENLAWNSGSDPFSQWYDNEKKKFDEHVDSGSYPNLKSYEFNAYAVYNTYSSIYSGIGHYLNVIDSSYCTTGFAICSRATQYPYTYAQVFSNSSGGYTVDAYEARFLEYYNSVCGDSIGQAEYAALEEANAVVAAKQEALEEAQAAAAAAPAEQEAATEALTQAQTHLAELQGETAALQAAVDSAEGDFNAAQSALASAQSAYDSAVAAFDEDEYDARVNAAQQALEAATLRKQNAEDALEARRADETAALEALNDATDLSSATIEGIETPKQYDGTAQTQDNLVVKKTISNGEDSETITLTLNEDYTVSYSDQINAGTATVTVTGTGAHDSGNFWGEKSATFEIQASTVIPGLEFSVENGEVTITKYTGTATSLEIPSQIGGNPVTVIGKSAFRGCASLKSVVIPNGVSKIDLQAFSACTSLESVTIPDSVTFIEVAAFSSCSSLKSIYIPDSVTDIRVAFRGCTSLESFTVGEGNAAYTSVDGVLMSKDETVLWKYPAAKSGSSYTIPSSVTRIGDYAFDNCYLLESVTIPDSVNVILAYAFNRCTALKSVTISNSVKSIPEGTFKACIALESLTIPDSVTYIGSGIIHGCTSLKSVTVSDSVTHIVGGAFADLSDNSVIYVKSNRVKELVEGNCNTDTTTVKMLLSGATIGAISAKTYTGSAIKPTPTVTFDGVTLVKDTDYTLSYKNNVDAGTATVTVKGKGDYAGSKSKSFTINKSSTITLAAQTKTYTGKALAYSGTVSAVAATGTVTYKYYSDSACTKAVAASNVKNAGTYYVKATVAADANHNAATSAAVKFTIAKKASTISLAAQTKTYTGKALAYSGAVTKTGSTGAVTYKYYSDSACTKAVSAANVKNAGTYYVKATVAADANHTAKTSAAAKFTVAKKASTIKLAAQTKTYDGKAYTGTVTKTGSTGKVTYAYYSDSACTKAVTAANAKNAGTYYVKATVAADANHGAKTSAAVKLVINKKASTIKLAAQTKTYTGKALAYTGTVTKTGSSGKVTYKYYSNSACTKAVSASNVKNPGVYYVKATVAANTNYKAATSAAAKLVVRPKGTAVVSLTSGVGSVTPTWTKQATQTTGYQVRYSLKSDMSSALTVTVASPTTVKKTISGLKQGARYYVQVRTYKTVGTTKYYSTWSAAKSVVTKYNVYITRTGSKYHRSGCPSIANSTGLTTMTEAQAKSKGYTACKNCFH